MRAMIDATSVGSGLGGDETMICGVLRGLAEVGRSHDEFVVLASDPDRLPAEIHAHPSTTVTTVPRRSGVVHFTRDLPRVLASIEPVPDVVFSVTHAPLRSSVPVALMVQDLSFHHRPDLYPTVERMRLRSIVPRQLRTAAAVLTVSDHARNDLISSFALDPGVVFTVPNSIAPVVELGDDAIERGRTWLRAQGVDGRFILYLGNLHPRKNVARAIRAFSQLRRNDPSLADIQFVVAGDRWFRGDEEAQAAADAPPGSVCRLGRVDDDQREILLRDAETLVYVSSFEGFGLPPLEAMARGTAVVASSATSIPEVCADAAVLVDPLDTAAIADALRQVLTDPDLRGRLIDAGHRRVAHYTSTRTGLTALAAFDAVLNQEAVAR